ncbi:MAG: SH3 domain-containing protein [Caldilineaceae bacterium]
MVRFGRSVVIAALTLLIFSSSVIAQTITQETYTRLDMPAIKGIIYGAIDATAAFSDLGKDIGRLNDPQWQNRWYNAGFLIGWHGNTLAEMDSSENDVLEGVKQAAKKLMDGYDAVDLGIKRKNDIYIKAGAESIVEGMEYLVTIYAIIEPESIVEIQAYQQQLLEKEKTTTEVVTTATATSSPIDTSEPISSTIGFVNRNANLRSGPGTNYIIAGTARAGDRVEIVDQNADGSWFKLSDGKWIAAFLVNQEQSKLTTIEVTPVPTQPTVPVPTATPKAEEKLAYWGDTGVQTCGNFEWRVSNVRRTKDTWYYSRNQVAQGEYLLVYVEVKNISGGTASFWSTQPTMPGKEIAERASQYAAWMMTGGFNTLWKDDIAPGEFLTLVGAFDVAPDTHTYLFGAIGCKQLVMIGSWFELERGAVKAKN